MERGKNANVKECPWCFHLGSKDCGNQSVVHLNGAAIATKVIDNRCKMRKKKKKRK